MQLNNLIKARFRKRWKRFLMEVELESGEVVVAHTPNTGTMKTLLAEENFVYVEPNDNPKRKLKYTTQIIEFNNSFLGSKNSWLERGDFTKDKTKYSTKISGDRKFCLINTHLPNHLVREGIENKLVKELSDFSQVDSEVKYGKDGCSRIDILLNHFDNSKTFIEIKNATLKVGDGVCAFPDAPTERGRKHLQELQAEVKKGNRAVGFFLVSRNDCHKFRIAKEIDPAFYEEYLEARKVGVEFLAYGIDFKLQPNNTFSLQLDSQVEIIN